MSQQRKYADLEIRIRQRQGAGYPVELTLDEWQSLGRGLLLGSILS